MPRLPSCSLSSRADKTARVPVLRRSLEGRAPVQPLPLQGGGVSLVKSIWTLQLQGWKDTELGLERWTQMGEDSLVFLMSLPTFYLKKLSTGRHLEPEGWTQRLGATWIPDIP